MSCFPMNYAQRLQYNTELLWIMLGGKTWYIWDFRCVVVMTMTMMTILFDHNVKIEIIIFNSVENLNYELVWRLLLRQINLSIS